MFVDLIKNLFKSLSHSATPFYGKIYESSFYGKIFGHKDDVHHHFKMWKTNLALGR